MSEEQIPDTIDKLYDRLDDYDKQQLFNYGYLMEYARKLEKEVKYQNNEVVRLNNIIDELEKWLNKSIEYLLYGNTNKILKNEKKQFDEYGYFHDLGSINDIEGCLERVRKKLKELKEK